MSKVIVVPASWAMYKVEDDVVQLDNKGNEILPPLIALEVLAMGGKAERLGTIATVNVQSSPPDVSPDADDEDDSGDHGIWVPQE